MPDETEDENSFVESGRRIFLDTRNRMNALVVATDVERVARRMAATKMNLSDPSGSNLPDDLWTQCIEQAEKALAFDGKMGRNEERKCPDGASFLPDTDLQ